MSENLSASPIAIKNRKRREKELAKKRKINTREAEIVNSCISQLKNSAATIFTPLESCLENQRLNEIFDMGKASVLSHVEEFEDGILDTWIVDNIHKMRFEGRFIDGKRHWDICFDTRYKGYENEINYQSIHNLKNNVQLDEFFELMFTSKLHNAFKDYMVVLNSPEKEELLVQNFSINK